MNIQEAWEKALKSTEIIRPRVQPLHTFEATHIPYLLLSESSVNTGDTVVRKGEIIVEKPSLVLPFNLPYFEGFDFEEEMDINQDILTSFFLVRGVSFPSMRYNNKTDSIDVHEGGLSKAIEHFSAKLEREENVHTGLIAGAEDVWQFSVLIFTGGQIIKAADGDMKKLFDDFKRRGRLF